MASSTNATSPSTTTDYYHADQIGSARIITNGSGAVISTYVYTPFGQGPTPDENHYLFTGKERDAESGLDYFGARFYASSFMGRFMSPDDFGGVKGDPQSLNRYGYVENNPLSRVDPDGHMCMAADGMMCSTHDGPGSLVDAMRADMDATYSWELEDTPVGPAAQQQSAPASTVPMPVPPLAFPSSEGGASLLDGFLDVAGAALEDVVAPLILLANPASTATEAQDTIHQSSARTNIVQPDPRAQGDHSVAKRDPSGKVTGYTTFDKNGNEKAVFRPSGKTHGGVKPPLVKEPAKGKGPGSPAVRARPARPEEIPQ